MFLFINDPSIGGIKNLDIRHQMIPTCKTCLLTLVSHRLLLQAKTITFNLWTFSFPLFCDCWCFMSIQYKITIVEWSISEKNGFDILLNGTKKCESVRLIVTCQKDCDVSDWLWPLQSVLNTIKCYLQNHIVLFHSF